jgi:hypothetical protein
MTIDNFEQRINPVILKRGRDYFNGGLVGELEEEHNLWTADVYGSENYLVEITLNNEGEICNYTCDCPYDGDVCKHVAAVCYAIREEKAKQKPTEKSAKPKKNTFESLLEKISLDEYKNFIRSQIKLDKNFKIRFELFFSDKDENIDIEQKYREWIGKLVKKYYTHGYAGARSLRALSKEMDGIVRKGREMIADNNFRDAFLLSKAVLTELITIYSDCDDSNSDIDGTISETIELLDNLSSSDRAAMDLKQQLFDFLKNELSQKIYFDYGNFGYDLFGIFYQLALQFRHTEDFVDFIDNKCKKLTSEYGNYQKEFFLKEKIKFYREIGHDLADVLVKQNMDIVEIRKAEVDKAIDKQDYKEAKRLIAEGIEIAKSKGHHGTISGWKKEFLRIAYLENDKETIRQLTHYFTFDMNFSKEYYLQWRKTYPETEWKDIVEKKIADLTNIAIDQHKKSYWQKSRKPMILAYIAPILIEEEYWERLLTHLQAEPYLDTILTYHSHLAKRFPKEMLELYLPAFKDFGDNANGRSQYADLSRKMIRVMTDIPIGTEEIQTIASKLIAKNPRRPAMIEEMNKVLK